MATVNGSGRHIQENPLTIELIDLVGKNVTLTVASDNGGDNETYDARLETVTEFAAVVRPKGQRGAGALKLVKPELILNAEVINDPPRPIKAKRLKPVQQSDVRRHLLDAHFATLEQVEKMNDLEAWAYHEGMSHEGHGHTHDRGESEPNRGHREPCIGGHLCGQPQCPPLTEVEQLELDFDDEYEEEALQN